MVGKNSRVPDAGCGPIHDGASSPPSALPGISPTGGEIGCCDLSHFVGAQVVRARAHSLFALREQSNGLKGFCVLVIPIQEDRNTP